MAEIKIEKRKKKPVWPWILALLIIGGLVIWIWSDEPESAMEDAAMTTEERIPEETDEDRRARNERTGDKSSATADGAVNRYVTFVEENNGSMGKDHEYTKKGINRLSQALEAMAQQMPESPEVDEQVEQLKEQADQLTNERESTRHANMIRDAFTTSANLIGKFQEMNYPNMKDEVEDLKASAREVSRDELAMEQSDEVNQYFSESADVIKQMAQNIQS